MTLYNSISRLSVCEPAAGRFYFFDFGESLSEAVLDQPALSLQHFLRDVRSVSKDIIQLRKEGKSRQEIADMLGLTKTQIGFSVLTIFFALALTDFGISGTIVEHRKDATTEYHT